MVDDGWEQIKIPGSMFRRIKRFVKRKFGDDYGKQSGVPEFVREAVRLRLLDLGAYDEDEDEDESSNTD